MSTQRSPFGELEQLFERISDQIPDLRQVEGALGTGGIPVDLADRGDEFVVTADVPGCDTDHLDVSVLDGSLRIRAAYQEAVEEREANYLRRERRHRSTTRSISLPAPVDDAAGTAVCTDGVLTITLPKIVTDRSGRSIEVE